MNDEPIQRHSSDRLAAKAHFVARLNRYKDLLQRKWWVLLVGGIIGLAVEAALISFQPAGYVSTGRMIVNIKLQGANAEVQSTYSEEMNNFLGTQAALMQGDSVKIWAYERALAETGIALPGSGQPSPGAADPPPTNVAASSGADATDGQPNPSKPVGDAPGASGTLATAALPQSAALDTNLLPKVQLKVTVTPRTSIFVLVGTGTDPKFTKAFVQACMDGYINLKKEMVDRNSNTTITGMEEEVLRLDKELEANQNEIVAFQRTNSLVWLDQQGNSVGNYLVALNQKLALLNLEYSLLCDLTLDQNIARQSELTAAKLSATPPAAGTETDPPGADASQGSSAMSSDSLTVDYLHAKQALLLMKADVEDLKNYLRPKHPKMIAMAEEIARRETLLNIYRDQSKEQLENRKASVALQVTNLDKQIKEWNTKILDLGQKTAEYQRMKAKSTRIQSLYDHLLGTMQTLDVGKTVSPESITILEHASPPVRDRAGKMRKLLGAGLGCVVLSIGFLLLVDHMDDRVNSFTELQELFDENLLVQIPKERAAHGSDLDLVQPEDSRHSFIEAYRNLRSSLLYLAAPDKRPKTLLVTSSVPNEGKSITASNLAITIAQAGTRVLLVDADLRKGLLHRRFGLNTDAGLCEVLQEGRDWKPLVQATRFPHLSILARGSTTHFSSELFLSETAGRFLKEVSNAYDMVIVDTAPVLAADDVTSLAPLIDGTIFVLRAQVTPARIAHAALELLYQRQVNMLGLVFNAVPPRSVDYYYYYKYKDYYYYRDKDPGQHGQKPHNTQKRRHSRSELADA
ncbi:MAG: polysaccharide biosynthesis tyrosine autokinase [Limisphaerales bacterium]